MSVRSISKNMGRNLDARPERYWCSYCSRPAQSWDHVIPQCRKGEYRGQPQIDNLLPACNNCNQAKSDRPFIVFLADRMKKNKPKTS